MPDAPIRPIVEDMPPSLIREVANPNLGREDVIPLWFGESDLVTPDFIRDAAKAALDDAHTFYKQNEGDPDLRDALVAYLSDLYGKAVAYDRVTVTNSGMSAIFLVMETLIDPGDNVVVVTPVWPNCRQAVHAMGGTTTAVNLRLSESGWTLDLDEIRDAVGERTKAIFYNSPNNPSGWVISEEQIRALLEFCRDRGIWLIADDVYDRLVYEGRLAPSLIRAAEPEDAVISINSFSKSWCMTGWRLGWIVAPAKLSPIFGKLIEFNFSCATGFVQRAGIAALRDGEDFIRYQIGRCRESRDLVFQQLAGHPRVRIALPEGAFYAFFAVDGMRDSLAFARMLIDQAGVGLAPGAAFGTGGEGHLRLCFANSPALLSQALDPLLDAITAA